MKGRRDKFIVRGPLAEVRSRQPVPARGLEDPDQHRTYLEDLAKVERLRSLARGRTLAQLALQFVMAHPTVTVTIPGAKTVRQLEDNVGAALLPPLSGAEMVEIDTITPPGGGRKIWPA